MYVYAGDPGREYPDSGIVADPGDVVEVPPADDGRWFPVEPAADKGAPSTPPEPVAKYDTSPTSADVPAKDE